MKIFKIQLASLMMQSKIIWNSLQMVPLISFSAELSIIL